MPGELPIIESIENHAIIGDLNTVALVALNGSIDFMCFPRFDSPTIFASILDPDRVTKAGRLEQALLVLGRRLHIAVEAA